MSANFPTRISRTVEILEGEKGRNRECEHEDGDNNELVDHCVVGRVAKGQGKFRVSNFAVWPSKSDKHNSAAKITYSISIFKPSRLVTLGSTAAFGAGATVCDAEPTAALAPSCAGWSFFADFTLLLMKASVHQSGSVCTDPPPVREWRDGI